MKKITQSSLMAVLAAVLMLTGACANISDDSTRTKTEGALGGAAAGAGAGALIGGALGGKDGAVKGAGIGALIGGIAGFAYGSSVANKKAEYKSQEEWLAACLTEAKNVNKQASDLNSKLKASLASYDKELGSGGKSFDTGQVDKKQLSKNVKGELKDSQKYLSYLDQTITSQEQAISSVNNPAETKQLQKQVVEMKKQKELLEKNNRELAAISNRIAM